MLSACVLIVCVCVNSGCVNSVRVCVNSVCVLWLGWGAVSMPAMSGLGFQRSGS